MKKLLFTSCLLFTFSLVLYAQTLEELKALKKEKSSQVSSLQSEIKDIDKQIASIPGWKTGVFGTIGVGSSSFSNWQKGENPNSVSTSIATSFNAFANLKQDKYFWRNSGGLNLGWQKLDVDKDDEESADFEKVADLLKIRSLFGYNFVDNLAMSTLVEYNTAILKNFNNPGVLDFGVGFTWTPVDDLVIVAHPLNYHWVFGDNPEFRNALGAKFVVDYSKEIISGLNWQSNLTGFLSYKDTDPSLNEFTWTNSFGFNLWKGLGVGIEFAFRNAQVESRDGQSYLVFGISYAL